ncbi:transcriptional regulator [Parvularcula flava]|uniref:Transcriptional regulator n=1 Tax=Aquisalinus luteolus TaxID=1566827 RepID=A0A8J3A1F3_9PROT|nr:cupin-like domain-containing protein [Aquisalinus luteolus]NHK27546.1 transcriptional regulator [Aquisalinus luteolus]GGH95763.1 hypothetical protein GCM10011355_13070 [Aquisalinus luteolus]
MIFTDNAKQAFSGAYPDKPVRLAHNLAQDSFFSLERLADIATRLPAELVEYNRGDLPVDQRPEQTPGNGLSIAETIRSIEENGSWMVLKNVERDPACADKLEECLGDLEKLIAPVSGEMFRKEAFIFISSPNSITPFHMDPEHNILMQIRGTKQMRVYPGEGILTAQIQEAYHSKAGHRNLPYEASFDEGSTLFDLAPGDAVHVPVKAPHWVRNGPDVSISFSITWRSRLSVAEADLHRMNAWLRDHGLGQMAGTSARAMRVSAFRALNKAGIITD